MSDKSLSVSDPARMVPPSEELTSDSKVKVAAVSVPLFTAKMTKNVLSNYRGTIKACRLKKSLNYL